MLKTLRDRISKIDKKFENIPLRAGNAAYTENKSVITLCLEDPNTKKSYSVDVMTYVLLHELAHMISENYGHGDEFKKNFGMLLEKGIEKGIYNPNIPIPSTYCGVDTTTHQD
jgi:hypothetical protein